MKAKNLIFKSVFMIFLVLMIPVVVANSYSDLTEVKTKEVKTPLYQGPASDPGQACVGKALAIRDEVTKEEEDTRVIEAIFNILSAVCITITAAHVIIDTITMVKSAFTGGSFCEIPSVHEKFFFWSELACGIVTEGLVCGSLGAAERIPGKSTGNPLINYLSPTCTIGSAAVSSLGNVLHVGIDPYASMLEATMCLSIPGILFNKRKKRIIDLSYSCCLEQACANGLPTETCEQYKSYAMCMYEEGAMKKLIARVIASIVTTFIAEGTVCALADHLFNPQCIIAAFHIAQLPNLIMGVYQSFKYAFEAMETPTCSDLGFDEVKKQVTAGDPKNPLSLDDSNKDNVYDKMFKKYDISNELTAEQKDVLIKKGWVQLVSNNKVKEVSYVDMSNDQLVKGYLINDGKAEKYYKISQTGETLELSPLPSYLGEGSKINSIAVSDYERVTGGKADFISDSAGGYYMIDKGKPLEVDVEAFDFFENDPNQLKDLIHLTTSFGEEFDYSKIDYAGGPGVATYQLQKDKRFTLDFTKGTGKLEFTVFKEGNKVELSLDDFKKYGNQITVSGSKNIDNKAIPIFSIPGVGDVQQINIDSNLNSIASETQFDITHGIAYSIRDEKTIISNDGIMKSSLDGKSVSIERLRLLDSGEKVMITENRVRERADSNFHPFTTKIEIRDSTGLVSLGTVEFTQDQLAEMGLELKDIKSNPEIAKLLPEAKEKGWGHNGKGEFISEKEKVSITKDGAITRQTYNEKGELDKKIITNNDGITISQVEFGDGYLHDFTNGVHNIFDKTGINIAEIGADGSFTFKSGDKIGYTKTADGKWKYRFDFEVTDKEDIGNLENEKAKLKKDSRYEEVKKEKEAADAKKAKQDKKISAETGKDNGAAEREKARKDAKLMQWKSVMFQMLWFFTGRILDKIYDEVDQTCQEEYLSSEPESRVPTSSDNQGGSGGQGGGVNNCANSNSTILAAELYRIGNNMPYTYNYTYTITACKEEINYTLSLENSVALDIGYGFVELNDTAAGQDSALLSEEYSRICINVTDILVGKQCFPIPPP